MFQRSIFLLRFLKKQIMYLYGGGKLKRVKITNLKIAT